MSDDAKKLILARRARFVAATLASVGGLAAGPRSDAATDRGEPQACLSVALPEPDASKPSDAGDAGDAGDADAGDAGDSGDGG